jgi:hypothetical protein
VFGIETTLPCNWNVLDKRQFDRQAMGVGALGLPVPVPVPVPTRQWIDRFEARYMDSGDRRPACPDCRRHHAQPTAPTPSCANSLRRYAPNAVEGTTSVSALLIPELSERGVPVSMRAWTATCKDTESNRSWQLPGALSWTMGNYSTALP